MNTIRKLRIESQEMKPSVHVGKSGITDTLIQEITFQLKRKRLIKVKLLRNILESQDNATLCQQIVERTPCVLVRQVGNVITLSYKSQVIKARKPKKEP